MDDAAEQTLVEAPPSGSRDTYWYVFVSNSLGAVLKSTDFILRPGPWQSAAATRYDALKAELGPPTTKRTLRKGDNAFVEVRLDTWTVPGSNLRIAFLATNKELTQVAFTAATPALAELFVSPDPLLFPLEQSGKETITDFQRP